MNWFTAAGALMHLLHNVPDLVDDIEDFFQKLSGKEPPPEEVRTAFMSAVGDAKKP